MFISRKLPNIKKKEESAVKPTPQEYALHQNLLPEFRITSEVSSDIFTGFTINSITAESGKPVIIVQIITKLPVMVDTIKSHKPSCAPVNLFLIFIHFILLSKLHIVHSFLIKDDVYLAKTSKYKEKEESAVKPTPLLL